MTATLQSQIDRLRTLPSRRSSGRVVQVAGSVVCSEGPLCSVGEECVITTASGSELAGEVVGFRGSLVLSMPLSSPEGVRYGDRVTTRGVLPSVSVSAEVLGRVLSGTGSLLDGYPNSRDSHRVPLHGPVPHALARKPITEPLGCGVRAIDALLTCGRGQRLGIFGGSGVGKTTLIGMMTRATSADLTVLALVGERGREVGEFLTALGPEGRSRSVVVASTSNESPLLRLRAAATATAIAEFFAARGKNVLLVVDSLTRFAMAQREIGLAAGEPPTAKAYTPSVFSALAKLVERAGNFHNGSITAFYTVLMEGDDQQDPIVDAVRSLLDGHILLDRKLANANHYPPISISDSLSRLMPAVCSREQLSKAGQVRRLLALYQRSEDLLRVGAYRSGSDSELDRAIAVYPEIMSFLQQAPDRRPSIEESIQALSALPL
ncbi:MAG: FliI/YscN family ATPase [Acidobacteriaceae bacterium]